MGAIKDVVDLATQLSDSASERKFAPDLFKIIQLITTVQAEQTDLVEKNIQLVTENAGLKTTISSLESDISKLQNQISDLQNPSEYSQAKLDADTEKILKLFFEMARNLSKEEVCSFVRLEPSVIAYHFDILRENQFIRQASAAMGLSWVMAGRPGSQPKPATYTITPSGRKYIINTSN